MVGRCVLSALARPSCGGRGTPRHVQELPIPSDQSAAARSSSSKISTQSRTQRSHTKSPGPATSLGRSTFPGRPGGIVRPS